MGVYRLTVDTGMPSSPAAVINATGSSRKPAGVLQSPLVWLTLGAVVGALVVAAGSSSFSLQGAQGLSAAECAPPPTNAAALAAAANRSQAVGVAAGGATLKRAQQLR